MKPNVWALLVMTCSALKRALQVPSIWRKAMVQQTHQLINSRIIWLNMFAMSERRVLCAFLLSGCGPTTISVAPTCPMPSQLQSVSCLRALTVQ